LASQTVDFLVQTSAALTGQFVSLVSNKDGVTKYSAVVASDLTGKWLINPKPPAGTYTQWIGLSQGALTTQVDQDFVVDPMQDDGSAVFPGAVTVQLGGITVTGNSTITGTFTITAGFTVNAGGFTVTGNSTVTGTLTITAGMTVNAGGIVVIGNSTVTGTLTATGAVQGASFDVQAAGQLPIGPTNATSVAIRGPQKSLIVGTALTALGAGAQTLTAANLLSGEIEHTVTGAVADTFDTGANLDAAVPNAAVGDTFTCILTILGAFTVTLTAAAGITLRGTVAVVGTAAGKVCVLIMRRTGASAWTVYAATGA
jgi:hypothetical protein